jgi:hypothetical protein
VVADAQLCALRPFGGDVIGGSSQIICSHPAAQYSTSLQEVVSSRHT